MTHTNDLERVFRALEEDIRQAGNKDQTVPDILNLTGPELTETTRQGIREYVKRYHSWIELANEMAQRDISTEEEALSRLAAINGILTIAQYYIERLQAAVERNRDVPWETRVAVDLMLTAFGQQLGA